MKYPAVNWGQMEAVINKLGGMEGMEKFLAGELVVIEKSGLVLPNHALVTASKTPDIDWQLCYQKFGMATEFEAFCATNSKDLAVDPANWRTPLITGITPNKVVRSFRELEVKVECYNEDLDKVVMKNVRDPKTGSYVVPFKRSREVPSKYRNTSYNELLRQEINSITLLERLVLGFGYFVTTGKHLDRKSWTLCAGSEYSDGSIPSVDWNPENRTLHVYWSYRSNAYSLGGTRAVSAEA